MNLLQLHYFLVVASNCSITASAKALMISPSALSKSISRLEKDLDTVLFKRSDRGMYLTEAGVVVRAEASKAFEALNDMIVKVSQFSSNLKKHMSIATTALISVKDLIVAFKKVYPEIFISCKEIFSPDFCLTDLSGQYDFLITTEENTTNLNLGALRLFSHSPCLIVPVDHPLANRQSVSLSECSSLPLINAIPNTPWANYVNSIFSQAGLPFNPIMECPFNMRIALVSEGIGVTLASETSARLSSLPKNVLALKIDNIKAEHAVWLYWSKLKKPNNTSRLFIEFAKQYCK